MFKILYDESSAGSRKFVVEPETGLITTQGQLDRETTANYTVSCTSLAPPNPIFCKVKSPWATRLSASFKQPIGDFHDDVILLQLPESPLRFFFLI